MTATANTGCSIHGFPKVDLHSKDGKLLNPKQHEDNQNAPLLHVAQHKTATARLEYGGGFVSEDGTQPGVTCGTEAVRATVTANGVGNSTKPWQTKILIRGAGRSDTKPGGVIVCDPNSTVAPGTSSWHQKPDSLPVVRPRPYHWEAVWVGIIEPPAPFLEADCGDD